MRNLVFVVSCLVTSLAVVAEDEGPIVPATTETESPVNEQTLKQKVAELQKLQNQILDLGGSIGHPRRLRVSLRVVEIDCLKVKQMGLAHPLEAEKRNHEKQRAQDNVAIVGPWNGDIATDEELLKAFEPLVEKGCAVFLANPILTTSCGQTATVSCYREFPRNQVEDIRGDGSATDQEISAGLPARVPGFSIEILPGLIRDGEIRLTVKGRVNTEDVSNGIQINGRIIPGISSNGLQTTIRLKLGKPLVLGGCRMEQIPQEIAAANQADVNPNVPLTVAKLRDVIWLVTADEILTPK